MEYKVFETILSEMAEIMNVIPGEAYRIKDEETLLILQRRMEECSLKEELASFNEVFALKNGCTIPKLCQFAVSFIKIKILVEAEQTDYTPGLYRDLIKEFHAQSTKVNNIIHLSEVNAVAADEYQKEKIDLVMEKNKAFLEAFGIETAAIEKKIERLPAEEEKSGEQKDVRIRKSSKKSVKPPAEKPHGVPVVSEIRKHIGKAREKKAVDEKLKEVEKTSAQTRCKEIPYYEQSLVYTEHFICRDIPAYSILKRKNNVYFGLTKNVGKTSYDNKDQTLVELTEATDEFLQFMEVNLLSGEYRLSAFSQKEKDGLTMYFNFMSECFKKHIGKALTIQEYIAFKRYYNRLILKMFELEKEEKEDYYRALMLADIYMSYMEGYDLACADDEETIIRNIVKEKSGAYIDDLDLIIHNHIVDEDARADLEDVIGRMKDFHKGEEKQEPALLQTPYTQIKQMPKIPVLPMEADKRGMQIVIQILNQEHEIVDEAVYAGNNIAQALFDYQNRRGCSRRLCIRTDGRDVLYQEEKEQNQ